MMDDIWGFLPLPLFALVVVVGAAILFRVLGRGILGIRRQIAEGNRQNIRRALRAASITAACIFLTTYWSAWVAYRPFVALGRDEPMYILGNGRLFHDALERYAEEHGHYPDSLKDAFPKDVDFTYHVDSWKNPYHYARTDKGYRLFSLGRDAKPGGVGLDADFDLSYPPQLKNVPVTFSQFLFEGGGSGTLFAVALVASVCAALACFLLANSARQSSAISWPGLLLSVFATVVAAFFVVGVLMALYLIGNGH
jgi:hypothetical protein